MVSWICFYLKDLQMNKTTSLSQFHSFLLQYLKKCDLKNIKESKSIKHENIEKEIKSLNALSHTFTNRNKLSEIKNVEILENMENTEYNLNELQGENSIEVSSNESQSNVVKEMNSETNINEISNKSPPKTLNKWNKTKQMQNEMAYTHLINDRNQFLSEISSYSLFQYLIISPICQKIEQAEFKNMNLFLQENNEEVLSQQSYSFSNSNLNQDNSILQYSSSISNSKQDKIKIDNELMQLSPLHLNWNSALLSSSIFQKKSLYSWIYHIENEYLSNFNDSSMNDNLSIKLFNNYQIEKRKNQILDRINILKEQTISNQKNFIPISKKKATKIIKLFYLVFVKIIPKIKFSDAIKLMKFYFVNILYHTVNNLEKDKKLSLKMQNTQFAFALSNIEEWFSNMIIKVEDELMNLLKISNENDPNTINKMKFMNNYFGEYLKRIGEIHFRTLLKLSQWRSKFNILTRNYNSINSDNDFKDINLNIENEKKCSNSSMISMRLFDYWNQSKNTLFPNIKLVILMIWSTRWIIALKILQNLISKNSILNAIQEEFEWIKEIITLNPLKMMNKINKHISQFQTFKNSRIISKIENSLHQELIALQFLKTTCSRAYGDINDYFNTNLYSTEVKDWVTSFRIQLFPNPILNIFQTTFKEFTPDPIRIRKLSNNSIQIEKLEQSILKKINKLEQIIKIHKWICIKIPKASRELNLQIYILTQKYQLGTNYLNHYLEDILQNMNADINILNPKKIFTKLLLDSLSQISRLDLSKTSFVHYSQIHYPLIKSFDHLNDVTLKLNACLVSRITMSQLLNVHTPIIIHHSNLPTILFKCSFDFIHFQKKSIQVYRYSVFSEDESFNSTIDQYCANLNQRLTSIQSKMEQYLSINSIHDIILQVKNIWNIATKRIKTISKSETNTNFLNAKVNEFTNNFINFHLPSAFNSLSNQFNSQNSSKIESTNQDESSYATTITKTSNNSEEKWIYDNKNEIWIPVDETYRDKIVWNSKLNHYIFEDESIHSIFEDLFYEKINKDLKIHTFTAKYSEAFMIVCFYQSIPIDDPLISRNITK